MWFINYFHLQILYIELLFCWRLKHRPLFFVRLLPAALLYSALPFVASDNFFFEPVFTIGNFTFGFLFMLLLSMPLLLFVFEITFKQLVFYACIAHTIQHIGHCLYVILTLFIASQPVTQSLYLMTALLLPLLAWRVFRDQLRGSESADIKSTHLLIFSTVSTLLVYFISYWYNHTLGECLFDIMSCLLLLVILMDMFRFRRAEKQQLILERMLKLEREQQKLSEATVDVINRKCHDLKHQISALRNMSPEEQEKSISDLEHAILIYDSFAKTGLKDLDLILAEKGLLAEQQGIRIHVIADGRQLAFMSQSDLYSLLGNALDNALESTSLESPERRIITLHLERRGDMLSLHIENPCHTQPDFLDGMPVTTKRDKDFHGYGIPSMRYLAEKYGGTLTASWEDGFFSLDILFPLTGDSAV
mgnify:CR=1 FL=1